jgi:hypothetical protein
MRGGWSILLSFGVLLAACSFEPVPPGMTQFRCGEPDRCPDDHVCVSGVCRPDDSPPDDLVDAASSADAASTAADSGLVDSAPPDAAPADAGPLGPQTLRFGDHPLATEAGTLRDTFLSIEDPDVALGGTVSVVIDGDPHRVGLVLVDVAAITPGSRVASASLVVVLRDQLESGTLEIHALRVPWDPAAATYLEREPGVRWSTAGAGGDSMITPAAASAAPRQAGLTRLDLPASLVQGWVDAPGTNLGLRFQAVASGASGLSWNSSDHPTPDLRPYLEVVLR